MVLQVPKQRNGYFRQKKVWAASRSRSSRCRQRRWSPSVTDNAYVGRRFRLQPKPNCWNIARCRLVVWFKVVRTLFSGKKWLKSRWVPKELTEAQKRKRVEIATRLLRRHRRSPFFEYIVTCDEKWIAFVNYERHEEWRSPGQTPRKDFRAKKAILCVWKIYSRITPLFFSILLKTKNLLLKNESSDFILYCKQKKVRKNLEKWNFWEGGPKLIDQPNICAFYNCDDG